MKVVLEGLTLERFFLRPAFKMLHDVIGKVEKQKDHNGSDVNFWHNDALARRAGKANGTYLRRFVEKRG